jgi:cytochrome c biogenesis factor
MEIIYFTLAGIVLYVAADRALDWIEVRRGERFEHRTLIFFAIIMVLALGLFNLIERVGG